MFFSVVKVLSACTLIVAGIGVCLFAMKWNADPYLVWPLCLLIALSIFLIRSRFWFTVLALSGGLMIGFVLGALALLSNMGL